MHENKSKSDNVSCARLKCCFSGTIWPQKQGLQLTSPARTCFWNPHGIRQPTMTLPLRETLELIMVFVAGIVHSLIILRYEVFVKTYSKDKFAFNIKGASTNVRRVSWGACMGFLVSEYPKGRRKGKVEIFSWRTTSQRAR